MKITKMEVKTLFTITLRPKDIGEVITHYRSTQGLLRAMYPGAFDMFSVSNEPTYDELIEVLENLNRGNNRTYNTIAKVFGFDGWENSGYYTKERKTYTMEVYSYGDQVNGGVGA